MLIEQFQTYITEFIQHLKEERRYSPHTLRAYTTDLRHVISFWQAIEIPPSGTVNFSSFVERYHKNLSTNYDEKTIARKLSSLSSYVVFLRAKGFALEFSVARPVIREEKPAYLSIDEVFYILDKVAESAMPTQFPYRDKAIFELLYATGIGPAELVAIRCADLSLTNKSIIIRNRKRQRTVFFGQPAHDRLIAYLHYERSPIAQPEEILFLNYRQQPLTTRSIQRICGMFGNLLPQPRVITPQLLRHSCAVHLLAQGADLQTIQDLLGCTRITVEKYSTLGVLTHS